MAIERGNTRDGERIAENIERERTERERENERGIRKDQEIMDRNQRGS